MNTEERKIIFTLDILSNKYKYVNISFLTRKFDKQRYYQNKNIILCFTTYNRKLI